MRGKWFLSRVGTFVGGSIVLFYAGFPFYWAVVTSFKSGSALFRPEFWPQNVKWENYEAVFTQQPFFRNFLNSLAVAALAVGGSLLLGILAAYPLARREFRGRSGVLLGFLLVSMFPQIALLSGLFETLRALGIYNTVWGLAFSYLGLTLPFTVWSLTTFMREIPREIEDAARLDGAGPWQRLIHIFIPLMAPAFVTTGLLAFLIAWNEFLFALTFTLSEKARTVPVAIALMSGSSEYELPWGNIMAASVVVTLPVVLLVWVFQKKIVSGLTAGALKG
jgi:trehalose/maltose transport system permease protein